MGFHEKPTTYVDHVTLKIENLARSIQFYQEIIGFKVLEQTESSAKLTADGKTTLLSLEQPKDVVPKQARTTGMYHFALLLPDKKDLADIVVHLSNKGIRFGASDHLVSEALYLADPDGNEIEIYADRDPNEWSWNNDQVEMATKHLNFDRLLTNRIQGESWNGLPEKTIMGHIHLHVADLNKSEEFYVKGLGFEVVTRYGSQALFLSSGKYHHHIGLNTWNGVGAPKPVENSVGMESARIIYPSADAIEETVANLKEIGAKVTEENGRTIAHDPSGIRIQLSS